MRIKYLVSEDFVNYRLPSLFIGTSFCDFKCEKECGIKCCQNNPLVHEPIIDIDDNVIVDKYINNDITKAVVIGGLEPFLQFEELYHLIKAFRIKTDCDIVIYTGYYKEEILNYIEKLKDFKNIIVKFGRFIPNSKSKYDEILGIELASDNQYAEKIVE